MNEKETLQETLSRAVLGLVIGVSLLFAGFWAGRQLHTAWNVWPVVDGIVTGGTVAEVMEVPTAKGDGEFHQYQPAINIRYQVSGQEYTTDVPLGYTTTTQEKAAADLRGRYAAGTHQLIRYNPRDPKEVRFGALERGPLAFAFVLIIAGVMLAAVGLTDLARAYTMHLAGAPDTAAEPAGAASPFDARKEAGPTVRCASCGRIVEAGQETCPNCLKALRAA